MRSGGSCISFKDNLLIISASFSLFCEMKKKKKKKKKKRNEKEKEKNGIKK